MTNYCINLDMIVFKENKEKIAKNHFQRMKYEAERRKGAMLCINKITLIPIIPIRIA